MYMDRDMHRNTKSDTNRRQGVPEVIMYQGKNFYLTQVHTEWAHLDGTDSNIFMFSIHSTHILNILITIIIALLALKMSDECWMYGNKLKHKNNQM